MDIDPLVRIVPFSDGQARAATLCAPPMLQSEYACSRGAIEDLDGILGIQGLTGVFIGPNDLGLALGHDPTDSPEGEVLAMVEHVLARSHEHGKKAAIFCSDPSTAKRMADAGFDMVVVGMDVAWAAGGAAKALAAAKGP